MIQYMGIIYGRVVVCLFYDGNGDVVEVLVPKFTIVSFIELYKFEEHEDESSEFVFCVHK